MLWSTLLWLFQVVYFVLSVSVRGRLFLVVVRCSLFRLFQALYCLKSWFGLFCDANVVLTIELVVQPVLELFCFVSCWFRLVYGGFEML